MHRSVVPAQFAAALLFAGNAHAQHHVGPRACTVTPPSTIVAIHELTPVAVAAAERPATLFVLYHDRTAGPRTVSLLAVDGVDSPRPEVHLFSAGEGAVAGPALAFVRNRALAAFVAPNGRLSVFSHAIDTNTDRTVAIDGASGVQSVTLGASRTRAFVAWSDASAVHGAAVGLDGSASGHAWAWRGRAAQPIAVGGSPAFVLALDGDHVVAGGTANVAPTPIGTATGALGAAGVAGSIPLVALTHDGSVDLVTLRARRTHETQSLGAADGTPGTVAIGTTPWGAVAAWTHDGIVSAQPLDAQGHGVGTPVTLMDPTHPERAHAIAATGRGDDAIVVYTADHVRTSATGLALRMVRIRCQ